MATEDLEHITQKLEQLEIEIKRRVADELGRLSLPEFGNYLTDIIFSAGQYVDGHRDKESFKEIALGSFSHIKRHYDKILPSENYTSRWLQPLVRVRDLLPKVEPAIEAISNSNAQDKSRMEELYQNLDRVVQEITQAGLIHAANIQRLSEDVRKDPKYKDFKVTIPNNKLERGYT